MGLMSYQQGLQVPSGQRPRSVLAVQARRPSLPDLQVRAHQSGRRRLYHAHRFPLWGREVLVHRAHRQDQLAPQVPVVRADLAQQTPAATAPRALW